MLGARHQFRNGFTCELQVKGVRANFYIFSPGNSATRGDINCFEARLVVPDSENALPGQAGQINLPGSSVRVPQPYPVTRPWFYFDWPNHTFSLTLLVLTGWFIKNIGLFLNPSTNINLE
jgi:hypothetical protein